MTSLRDWDKKLGSPQIPLRRRVLQFAILLVVSWCVMTFTHEIGHIVCGWLSGGRLKSWELRPWRLPYSLFDPNPYPLVTLWGGPVLGIALPAAGASTVRRPWAWFIAYFCMLANGLYLAAGWTSVDRFLDTPQLLEHGAHSAAIAFYCLLTIPVGYIGFRRQCMTIAAIVPPGTAATCRWREPPVPPSE